MMLVEPTRDPETGATYYYVTDHAVAKTVCVADVINVDLDSDGEVVGVEFVVAPERITAADRIELAARFPILSKTIPALYRGTQIKDTNERAAAIVKESTREAIEPRVIRIEPDDPHRWPNIDKALMPRDSEEASIGTKLRTVVLASR